MGPHAFHNLLRLCSTTLGSFAPQKKKKVHPDQLGTLSGNNLEQAALSGSNRSSWRVISVRLKPQARYVRLITVIICTAFGKRRNGGTFVGYSGRTVIRESNVACIPITG
jgi:hypothetical protein